MALLTAFWAWIMEDPAVRGAFLVTGLHFALYGLVRLTPFEWDNRLFDSYAKPALKWIERTFFAPAARRTTVRMPTDISSEEADAIVAIMNSDPEKRTKALSSVLDERL